MENQNEAQSQNGSPVPCSDLLAAVRAMYPQKNDYFSVYDYAPLLKSFGEILLQVDDSDYQGDSRLIYKRGANYGLLIFGWGSCSGCDSLQACNSYEEIEELRKQLENDIKWGTVEELLTYLNTHDWEGDYSWHAEETKQFVAKAKDLLNAANGQDQPRRQTTKEEKS